MNLFRNPVARGRRQLEDFELHLARLRQRRQMLEESLTRLCERWMAEEAVKPEGQQDQVLFWRIDICTRDLLLTTQEAEEAEQHLVKLRAALAGR